MFINRKNELIDKVENLRDFVTDLKNKNIINNIENFLYEIKNDLTFNVLCLGDFSSGKSTFINQFFIKQAILPTSVTTTTAKLTIIKYGSKKKVVVVFKDKTKKEFSENLENSLKEFVAKNGKEVDKIDYVEVYINSEFLKEGVVIVDSPGLNDPEVERMKVTFEYIKRADSILYLLTAMQAWKKSEKEFLEEKILRKEDLDKIFFLLNYWDIIKDEEERKSLLEYINNEIQKSIKIASAEIGKNLSPPPLIPISAKTKENFNYLYKQLWEYLGSKKGEDILQTKYKKLEYLKKEIKNLLEEKIEIQKREKTEITNTINKLKEEIEKYKKDVNIFREGLKEKVTFEVENWLEEIKDFYLLIKDKIFIRINTKVKDIQNIEEFKNEIRNAIHRTIYLEEDNLQYKNQVFLKNIEKIAKEERAKLNIDKYFIKNKVININKLNSNIKNDINPQIKNDYLNDFLITGSSIAIGAFLATIASPLALLSLTGIGYNIISHNIKEREMILKQLPILEEQIEEIISKNINQIFLKKDEIIEEILNGIKNDIVEAYEEKVNAYNEALKIKNNNQDNKIIEYTKQKIKILESI